MRIRILELFNRIKPWWAYQRYWRLRQRFSAELFPHFIHSLRQQKIWHLRYRDETKDFPFHGKEPCDSGVSGNYPHWKGVFLNHPPPPPARILEIGSWMGGGTVAFAMLFPNATISCIDTWQGSDRLTADENPEKYFDENTAAFGERIRKITGTSIAMLAKLAADGEKFDLIYVDAGHHEDEVRSDTELAWPLLNVGGVMIWDDYLWEYPPFGDKTPKPAIDKFLRKNRGKYRVLFAYNQVIVEKLA